jgi:kumamolisin
LLHGSRPAGPINKSEIASVSVRMRSSGDIADLEKQVADLYARPLAKRTYVSRTALAKSHGARGEDLDAVERFAQVHNLAVSQRSSAERNLVLTGRLGDILEAFHADLRMFHHASGTYRGCVGEIHIPRALKGVITGVFGLDTRPKYRSPHRHKDFHAGPGGGKGKLASAFAQRYHFPVKSGKRKLDGTGQTIALIELGGGFSHSDLQVFFREAGIALPKVVSISTSHTGNHPTKKGLADGEVMLDIEVAGAVAPEANIAIYFGSLEGKGFLDAVNAAVHDADRNPSVISISWGGPEELNEPQMITACHEVFLEAALLGITICAASGDHGTADLPGASWDGRIHVDHPAADDLVLACGGTQVDGKGEDIVWNDGKPFGSVPNGGGWASGGGISRIFPVPSYQKKAKVPRSIDTHKRGRGVPDIAMSATNYLVRVHGSEKASGGTSAVAPLMAALIALLNQAKGKNIGFLNPFLYANTGVVQDVTKGTNGIVKAVPGYKAVKGWDACTGLGTPNGSKILKSL